MANSDLSIEYNDYGRVYISGDKTSCSLSSAINAVFSLKHDPSISTLYFRGEPKLFPYRTPSLYLIEELAIRGSKDYFQKLICTTGKEDYLQSTSLVRTMADLQHFGAKTRWLDVSESVLTALFFSAFGEPNDDGYIYIFSVPKEEEKYDTGHTIAIKTALNLMPQNVINNFILAIDHIRFDYGFNNLGPLEFDFLSHASFDAMWNSEKERDEQGTVYYKYPLFEKYNFNNNTRGIHYLDMSFIKTFMDLLNQRARVRERLVYPFSIYNDIRSAQHCICSLSNDRIKQQHGSFIFPAYANIFGDIKLPIYRLASQLDIFMNHYVKEHHKEIHNKVKQQVDYSFSKYLYKRKNGKYLRIRIPKESKTRILRELNFLGINEGFLFADVKNASETIIHQF